MTLITLRQLVLSCTIALLFTSCFDKSKYAPRPYVRPLEIVKISDSTFLHISYLKDTNGGYIGCNGFIYKSGDEAIIFDTPINDSISNQLIEYVQKSLKATVKGVVVSHSHVDAAGGVGAFSEVEIPSYASTKTANMLARDSIFISQPFDSINTITLGKTKIESRYLGPAHSDDNIVSYIEHPDILIGGCMIKPLGGREGNLKDANLEAWSNTVTLVKQTYPDTKIVIPGHGGRGGADLLDYTSDMFKKYSPKEIETEKQGVQN